VLVTNPTQSVYLSPMQQGVLSGKEIETAIRTGEINISPFEVSQLNPASYDLTLGDEVTMYKGFHSSTDRLLDYLDPKKDNPTTSFKMGPEGYILKPGIGYLMHTKEVVGTNKYVPAIDGKSSIGRLFVLVHVTAGLGDPGFNGQYTLEVLTTYPIRLYPGMRICQVRFFTIRGEIDLYKGHYQGDTAKGAVSSHAYEQFGGIK
jgi:dCTP deaminase